VAGRDVGALQVDDLADRRYVVPPVEAIAS
jgi:hypothetical protein